MRLHGWCTECRRVKLVRVSGHGMSMLAVRRVAQGICDQCEREADAARKARFERRT